jgi:hypothetical protein
MGVRTSDWGFYCILRWWGFEMRIVGLGLNE